MNRFNRFVIYAFAVGIVGGFFIGKFIGVVKKSPAENEDSAKAFHTMVSDTENPQVDTSKTFENKQGKSTPSPAPALQGADTNVAARPQSWPNSLLILEDAYKKKDWSGFLQVLEQIQADEANPMPGITALLKNGFAQSAITSIQDMDNRNALLIAENILKGQGNKDKKIEVLKNIGKTGKDATYLLKWVAENEKDVHISSMAINALGETKDPAVIPVLSDYVKGQHALPVRLAAIEAFANFDSSAIPSLETLLSTQQLGKGNEQLVLKSTIIETLANIGNTEAVTLLNNLSRNQGTPEDSDSFILQQDAIAALGDIGSPEALFAIREIIANKEIDAQLRGFALDTLVEAKQEDSVPVLEDIINDVTIEDMELKKAAIGAIGDIKGPEAITLLAELVARPDTETPGPLQSEALSAIGRIGGYESVPILENIINNEYIDTDIRKDAIFTLGRVGTDTAVSVLERIINDTSDQAFSRAALRGLQKIGSSHSISVIENVARAHPSEDTRMIASKLLEMSRQTR